MLSACQALPIFRALGLPPMGTRQVLAILGTLLAFPPMEIN